MQSARLFFVLLTGFLSIYLPIPTDDSTANHSENLQRRLSQLARNLPDFQKNILAQLVKTYNSGKPLTREEDLISMLEETTTLVSLNAALLQLEGQHLVRTNGHRAWYLSQSGVRICDILGDEIS